MATYSSILAWKIPWTEELGGLHTVYGVAESDMTEHVYVHFSFIYQITPISVGISSKFSFFKKTQNPLTSNIPWALAWVLYLHDSKHLQESCPFLLQFLFSSVLTFC